ncbi:hypothetical protein V8C86DRAFT_3161376 [Haematococcus lacustris]
MTPACMMQPMMSLAYIPHSPCEPVKLMEGPGLASISSGRKALSATGKQADESSSQPSVPPVFLFPMLTDNSADPGPVRRDVVAQLSPSAPSPKPSSASSTSAATVSAATLIQTQLACRQLLSQPSSGLPLLLAAQALAAKAAHSPRTPQRLWCWRQDPPWQQLQQRTWLLRHPHWALGQPYLARPSTDCSQQAGRHFAQTSAPPPRLPPGPDRFNVRSALRLYVQATDPGRVTCSSTPAASARHVVQLLQKRYPPSRPAAPPLPIPVPPPPAAPAPAPLAPPLPAAPEPEAGEVVGEAGGTRQEGVALPSRRRVSSPGEQLGLTTLTGLAQGYLILGSQLSGGSSSPSPLDSCRQPGGVPAGKGAGLQRAASQLAPQTSATRQGHKGAAPWTGQGKQDLVWSTHSDIGQAAGQHTLTSAPTAPPYAPTPPPHPSPASGSRGRLLRLLQQQGPPWSGPQAGGTGHMGSAHGQVRPEPTRVVGSRGRHSSSSSRAAARTRQLQQAALLSRGLSRASGRRVLQRAGHEDKGILAELSRLSTARLLLLGAAGAALSLNMAILAVVSAELLIHWLLH